MSIVTDIIMILGGFIAILAAVGLHKFDSPYARFHAAGKASPVAFLVAAVGAGISLGAAGAALLTVAAAAMIFDLARRCASHVPSRAPHDASVVGNRRTCSRRGAGQIRQHATSQHYLTNSYL